MSSQPTGDERERDDRRPQDADGCEEERLPVQPIPDIGRRHHRRGFGEVVRKIEPENRPIDDEHRGGSQIFNADERSPGALVCG
jgi:hypothetical protein